MLNSRRVQCGSAECKRIWDNDRTRRYLATYKAKTGESYKDRYKREVECPGCGEVRKVRPEHMKREGFTGFCQSCIGPVSGMTRWSPYKRTSGRQKFRRAIFERDRWICGICRRRVSRKLKWPHRRSAVIDHIIPLAAGPENGGVDEPHNMQCAHHICNSIKTDSYDQAALF